MMQSNLNKFKVGDIIMNSNNTRFFVSRSMDSKNYTIVDVIRKSRLELPKSLIDTTMTLSLSSTLKNL